MLLKSEEDPPESPDGDGSCEPQMWLISVEEGLGEDEDEGLPQMLLRSTELFAIASYYGIAFIAPTAGPTTGLAPLTTLTIPRPIGLSGSGGVSPSRFQISAWASSG